LFQLFVFQQRQVWVDGKSVKRNLDWRPRKVLQEGDRIGVVWRSELSAMQLYHNGKMVVEKIVENIEHPGLYPLIDVAGNVKCLRIIEAAKKPLWNDDKAANTSSDEENAGLLSESTANLAREATKPTTRNDVRHSSDRKP